MENIRCTKEVPLKLTRDRVLTLIAVGSMIAAAVLVFSLAAYVALVGGIS